LFIGPPPSNIDAHGPLNAVGDGSAVLWELAQRIIDDAVTRGWLAETGR
jgi:hypothetical protein